MFPSTGLHEGSYTYFKMFSSKVQKHCYVSQLVVLRLCRSWDEAHGQAVLVLHWLLRQVVGLPDAVERAALAGTHSVPRQQSDQDGLHHHHGDVFANTGTRPAAKGLEVTAGYLPNRGSKDSEVLFCFFKPRNHTLLTYCFFKVLEVELLRFGEEFGLVHETNVENDVSSFLDFCSCDVIVLQSFPHREIHHRMKPQRLVDEILHHFQTLIIKVFCIFIICKGKICENSSVSQSEAVNTKSL